MPATIRKRMIGIGMVCAGVDKAKTASLRGPTCKFEESIYRWDGRGSCKNVLRGFWGATWAEENTKRHLNKETQHNDELRLIKATRTWLGYIIC